ncbi:MAG: hypothetical protein N2037_05470 [Acidimicrobiales bacterium]|nr:hypothetical protein [Acidimicrobiales bacterium]
MIASTALLDPTFDPPPDLVVGPFAVIGADPPDEPSPTTLSGRTIIRSHAVLYRGVAAGPGLHVGHGALIREHTRIGARVSIGSGCIIEHHVVIEEGARLHSGCFVPEHTVIGPGAWLGPRVVVTNARFPNRPDTKDHLEGVLIEEDAVIGAAAVLLPGIRIGAGALVGAGAVVVRDVPPGTRVVGNPARELL